ncbi:rhomboid family intramembrane serine protease [Roseivirga sp. BDSF3-8]|uniref:rhomboid family intramembrane serine protease n=1 Tax=Roseivirga sp. BDSF3-8 TaxID=3241598 RepID=UPI003531FA2E
MFRFTPVVKMLLIINVAMLLLNLFLGGAVNKLFALYTFRTENFAFYQFFSYMFLHAGWWHLFTNMFALVIFGPLLEQKWGANRFLAFYIAVGVGAGVLYGAWNYHERQSFEEDVQTYLAEPTPTNFYAFLSENVPRYSQDPRLSGLANEYDRNPESLQLRQQTKQVATQLFNVLGRTSGMVGASGAVFGILAAFGLLFPNLMLVLLFPPIPVKAKYLVIAYMFFEVYAGLQRAPGDNVAHFAHIAGAIVAFVVVKLIWKEKRVY